MCLANAFAYRDFASATVTAQVLSADHYHIRFREQEDFIGPTAGYHFKQLLVDGDVVWEEDVAGGKTEEQDVEVDITAKARDKSNLALTFRLLDKKGVSNFGIRWICCDLKTEGLIIDADLQEPQKWRVKVQGPLEAGFGDALQKGEGRFHIPYFVMTAADIGEFRQRHGNPASSERITDWLRMCLKARREGKCDGVVTYCLDKSPQNLVFPPVAKVFREFLDDSR